MLAYIGPGSGFALTVSLLTIVVVTVSVALAPILAPASAVWCAIRRRRVRCARGFRRVVVLGLDGLDPKTVRRLMAAGRLPHMAALARSGHFSELKTVTPAMTPAAWSSFMTGTDPSRHAIFDFITRDRRTYLPRLTSSEVAGPRRVLRVGRWRVPLSRPRVRMLRKGIPFWHALGRHGLEVTVLRVPVTFPPEPFRGRVLSGMCVPDLGGSQGAFSYYATTDRRTSPDGGEFLPLEFSTGGVARSEIRGPDDPLGRGGPRLTTPLVVRRAAGSRGLRIKAGGRRFDLAPGAYSDWVSLQFRAGPLTVKGIAQFYLKTCGPEVELYMTPVQIDPERPAMRISEPALFSGYLAKSATAGPFATLGLAEDTSALNCGAIDEDGFLRQTWRIYEERKAMFLGQLDARADDVAICVFDTPDRIQHMFWRFTEPGHPSLRNGDKTGHRYGRVIDDMVVEMDDLVGQTVKRLPKECLLVVLSDHGFTSFRRGVNLNAWLRERGFLHLLPGASGREDWLQGVDWSRTRAYALGLTGIFINLEGREAKGIVSDGPELDRLLDELRAGLEGLRDEAAADDNNAAVVRRAMITRREWTGPYRLDGPDLIVGYREGYRCSWDCANGRVEGTIFSDNTRPWSGDHCVDPDLVPGVLLANARLAAQFPCILDLAPTVLDVFGIPPDAGMQGRSLLRTDGGAQT